MIYSKYDKKILDEQYYEELQLIKLNKLQEKNNSKFNYKSEEEEEEEDEEDEEYYKLIKNMRDILNNKKIIELVINNFDEILIKLINNNWDFLKNLFIETNSYNKLIDEKSIVKFFKRNIEKINFSETSYNKPSYNQPSYNQPFYNQPFYNQPPYIEPLNNQISKKTPYIEPLNLQPEDDTEYNEKLNKLKNYVEFLKEFLNKIENITVEISTLYNYIINNVKDQLIINNAKLIYIQAEKTFKNNKFIDNIKNTIINKEKLYNLPKQEFINYEKQINYMDQNELNELINYFEEIKKIFNDMINSQQEDDTEYNEKLNKLKNYVEKLKEFLNYKNKTLNKINEIYKKIIEQNKNNENNIKLNDIFKKVNFNIINKTNQTDFIQSYETSINLNKKDFIDFEKNIEYVELIKQKQYVNLNNYYKIIEDILKEFQDELDNLDDEDEEELYNNKVKEIKDFIKKLLKYEEDIFLVFDNITKYYDNILLKINDVGLKDELKIKYDKTINDNKYTYSKIVEEYQEILDKGTKEEIMNKVINYIDENVHKSLLKLIFNSFKIDADKLKDKDNELYDKKIQEIENYCGETKNLIIILEDIIKNNNNKKVYEEMKNKFKRYQYFEGCQYYINLLEKEYKTFNFNYKLFTTTINMEIINFNLINSNINHYKYNKTNIENLNKEIKTIDESKKDIENFIKDFDNQNENFNQILLKISKEFNEDIEEPYKKKIQEIKDYYYNKRKDLIKTFNDSQDKIKIDSKKVYEEMKNKFKGYQKFINLLEEEYQNFVLNNFQTDFEILFDDITIKNLDIENLNKTIDEQLDIEKFIKKIDENLNIENFIKTIDNNKKIFYQNVLNISKQFDIEKKNNP